MGRSCAQAAVYGSQHTASRKNTGAFLGGDGDTLETQAYPVISLGKATEQLSPSLPSIPHIFPPESQQLLFIFRHEPEITYRIEGQRFSVLAYAGEGF